MKLDIENVEQVSENMFPMVVSICGIKSLNYVFDPETLKPWSNDVVEYNDIYRSITILGSRAPNVAGVQDIEKLRQLIVMGRQLIENYSAHATNLHGFDKPIEIQLQRSALIIYLAKCWEDWAFKMHYMFAGLDKIAADNQVKYIYLQYVIPYYQEVLECSTILGRSLPLDITEQQRKSWGIMTVYAKNKFFATLPLYGDEDNLKYKKKTYKNYEDVLVKNGLSYLVPDYIPEVEEESHLLSDAKDIIWSAWKNMYGYVCNSAHTAYEHIHQEPEHIEHKIAPDTPDMSRNDVKQPAQSENPGLRQRKVNPPKI